MKITSPRIVLPLLTIVILPLCAYGQHPKEVGGRAVKSATWEGQQIDYISGQISIKLTPSTKSAQASALFEQYNAEVVNPIGQGWGIIQLPHEKNVLPAAKALKKSPLVSEAGPTVVGRTTLAPDDPYFQGDSPASYNHQWGLENAGQSPPGGTNDADIDATAAWNETTGSSSTVVAVLDSGIPMQQDGDSDWDEDDLSHPDLDDPNKIIVGPDYIDFNQANGVKDELGHGTHVAGIAAAESDNDKGVSGVCWNCKLMVVQVADDYGNANWPAVYDGVEHAVDYAVNNNVEVVINASLGFQNDPNGVGENAVEYAENHGVPVVVSAGNEDGGDVLYPAAYSSGHDNVIAVSSTDHNDDFSSFSSSGSEVNVAAPGGHGSYVDGNTVRWDGSQNEGTNIYSTTPNYSFTLQYDPVSPGDPYTSDITQDYGYLNGTSMAAPYVAGTAALMLSETPSLTPSEVRSALESTAKNVNGGSSVDNQIGHGRINADLAVAKVTPPPAPAGFQITNGGQGGEHPQLSWNTSQYANSYDVYRLKSDEDNSFKKIGTTQGYSNTSYTDTGTRLADYSNTNPDGTVHYKVKAVNEYGSSNFSNADAQPYDDVPVSDDVERPALAQSTIQEFEAHTSGPNAALEWAVRPEAVSSSDFAVQHRADRTATWTTVGNIPTADSVSTDSTTGAAYRFETDRPLDVGTHRFRLAYETAAGTERRSGVVTAKIELSEAYRLRAYPNPAQGRATVALAVKEKQNVKVRVYDILGRRVTTLYDGPLRAQDTKRLSIRASEAGLSSGTYFVRAAGEGFVATERLTVVR